MLNERILVGCLNLDLTEICMSFRHMRTIFFFWLQYDFEGRKDLVRFIKLVKQAGLYVVLRIGPYVCAEWNYG